MQTHARKKVRTLLAALATVALATLFLGPTANADTGSTTTHRTWTVHVGAQSRNGAIQAMQFLPGQIWIDVGDTVHWTAASMEPHTVTLLRVGQLPPPFDPTNARQTTRTAATSITTPGQFRNSGILATMPIPELPTSYLSYDLTFTGRGDFVYYCLLHGKQMKGVVHVAAAGTPYPHTQAYYDMQYRVGRERTVERGFEYAERVAAGSTNHHVYVGAVDPAGMFMVMRFLRTSVTIHKGDTIDFDWSSNHGFPVPHTVTFGPEPPAPIAVGTPGNFTGGQLSSGVLPTAGPGAHFRVTFNKAGTYSYICMFHDGMGMVGKVVVTS